MKKESFREKVIELAIERYQAEPEHPWAKFPKHTILRNRQNKKWYALVMDVTRDKLGLEGMENVAIMNVKADPVMADAFRDGKGIFPAYHMNKANWITVLLDGTVPMDTISLLLDTSYDLVCSRKKEKKSVFRNTEWIVPANPKFFDIDKAIQESKDGTIIWKQSNNICVGDKVYLYVAAPVSAIRYKFKAVEVDIPYEYEDKNMSMKRAMRVQLMQRYDKEIIDLAMMKEFGVSAVRGPRSMPNSLKCRMEELYGNNI